MDKRPKKITRAIVFGNQQIALSCLDILLKRKDVDVVCVVGCPAQLDTVYGYPSVKAYCDEKKLLYLELEVITRDFYTQLKKLSPDICFSIYYRKIFPKYFLKLAPMGFVNVHNSLLPKNRGPVPTLWSLLNNDSESGITLHYIDSGVDTGDIIAQSCFKVPRLLTGFELNDYFMRKGVILFRRELSDIIAGTNNRYKQKHKDATYYGPFQQSMRVITWGAPSSSIINRVRAFAKPYLGAIAGLLDKELLIWDAQVYSKQKQSLTGPGKIVKVLDDGSFVVSTADGFIQITKYSILDLRSNQSDYIKVGNRFNL